MTDEFHEDDKPKETPPPEPSIEPGDFGKERRPADDVTPQQGTEPTEAEGQPEIEEADNVPKVSGFDENAWKTEMDDQAVRDELGTYPPEFVSPDRIGSVDYVPEIKMDDGGIALGNHEKEVLPSENPDDPMERNELGHIHLYEGNDTANQTKHTLGHEIGEDVYRRGNDTYNDWQNLHTESSNGVYYDADQGAYVADESGKDPSEDFADSFACYHNDPEALKSLSAERYQFMRSLYGDEEDDL